MMGKLFRQVPEDRLTASELLEEPFFHSAQADPLTKPGQEPELQDHLRTTARSQADELDGVN